MPEPIEMKMELPPGFTAACEALGLEPQAALQEYMDHLSVFVHFTPADTAPHSVASTIFKSFIGKRRHTAPPDAHRDVHTRCIQQLVPLIQSKTDPAEKEQQYHRLIRDWYDGLTKTE